MSEGYRALGQGTLDLLWGSLWSSTGARLLRGAFGTLTPFLLWLFWGLLLLLWASVGVCCLCTGTHNKELLQKQKSVKPKELCHFPAPVAAGPSLPVVRATLPSLTALSLWVGWGFCAILIPCRHSLTFGELQQVRHAGLGQVTVLTG